MKKILNFITNWEALLLVLIGSLIINVNESTLTLFGYQLEGYLLNLLASVLVVGMVRTTLDCVVNPIIWIVNTIKGE